MRGRLRPSDLLVATVALDAGLDALLMHVLGHDLGGLALILVAAALVVWFHHRPGRPPMYLLVALLFALPQLVLILLRPAGAPVDDALTATNAAAQRLLLGRSPYGHDYLDVAQLRSYFNLGMEFAVNPILAHFPYPPGAILVVLPAVALHLDAVWMWPPAALILALAADFAAGTPGLVAVSLSPLLLLDYLNLYNDLFFLSAALFGLGWLIRGRPLAAGLCLGAALTLKQTAIVFLPLALIWFPGWRRLLVGVVAVGVILVLPFWVWNPGGFVADTASYFYSSGGAAFPIRGLGLAGLLLRLGVIQSRWAPFPAAEIQIPFLILLLVAAVRRRPAHPLSDYWLWTAVVAAILFVFGRTLAPNYVTLIALLLALWVSCGLDRNGSPAIAEAGV
ncbi:MAG TPA: hypothetical protein VNI34_08450 [Candidatus Nitrosotalea sp.]|nr:hypothetical protein [Candidatus Nitrosotalea sp.]